MQYNYKLIFFTTILLVNFALNASAAATEEIAKKTSRGFTSLEEKHTFLLEQSKNYSAPNNLPFAVIQGITGGLLGKEILEFKETNNKSFSALIQSCRIAIQVRNSFAHLASFETPADGIALNPMPITGFASVSPKFFSEFPHAEQMYLINIRYNLHEPNGFANAIKKLKELTVLVQQAALETETKEAQSRASFLVKTMPFIKTVSAATSEYLCFVLSEQAKLQPNVASKFMAWMVTPAPKSPTILAQEAELKARQALAYTAFDSVFGNISMPATIGPAISLEKDDSANNRLQKRINALHSAIKHTKAFKALDTIVDHTGEVILQAAEPINSIEAKANLRSTQQDFITGLLAKTADYLAIINAAIHYAATENIFQDTATSFTLHSTKNAAKEHLANIEFVDVNTA